MGTHHKGSIDERRALDAFIKLVRAADSVASRVNAHLADHGLTVSQFGVLEALYHLGPMCQKALGAKLLKSGGNITMVVDNLERRRLVQRNRDTSDRRLITVRLTDEGEGIIATLFPAHVRSVVHEMAEISTTEQEQLGKLCRRLGRKTGL